ncbi:MAG: N-acylglucosamine 2-epimerase [Lachnospiraceae bacterium]|nr:N-acylglucosamine 2-epimerase [Lachnospiraceae bacterium]
MYAFVNEIETHLKEKLIPFWEGLKDKENGGYYGYMGYDLAIDTHYEKGCILNSRILWFFSNAYMLLGEDHLKDAAEHAYKFLKDCCIDKENGGVYWSVTYNGKISDDTKHTYNQAFAIYALSSYYDAIKDEEALKIAEELFNLIEEKCTDEYGYLEAFSRTFEPAGNDKLSENGVMADKTMNTLLHVFEAYTEYYRVSHNEKAAARLRFMLDIFKNNVYNEKLGRQEVFFDQKYTPLIDLYSYGHDIETAWLLDRGLEVLGDSGYIEMFAPVTHALAVNIYNRAFVNGSVLNEAENGVNDTTRIWWVQAESIVGFINEGMKIPGTDESSKYFKAAEALWEYIKEFIIDKREGSEWFWSVNADGEPCQKPIVEPWKCPYHNGRMCIEIVRRMKQ